jgi:hypothetical protein
MVGGQLGQPLSTPLDRVFRTDLAEEGRPVLGTLVHVTLPTGRIGQDTVDIDDGDHVVASSSGRGHEHTRLRSP